MTLFGSSAGSFDTVGIIASPLSEGLITGAAVQGQSYWGLTGEQMMVSDAENFGLFVANQLGCRSVNDAPACLRETPADKLVIAAGPGDVAPTVGGSDLPLPPLQLSRQRETVPLLIGFDQEEDSTWHYPFKNPYRHSDWVKDTNKIAGAYFGVQARRVYPQSTYGSLLWGADVIGSGYVLSPADQTLSQRMTDYWTNFAKSGNANGPGRPAWPPYDTITEPTLTLDNEIGIVNRYHAQECQFIDSIVPFPAPWQRGQRPPPWFPPGFLLGRGIR